MVLEQGRDAWPESSALEEEEDWMGSCWVRAGGVRVQPASRTPSQIHGAVFSQWEILPPALRE